MNYNHKKICNLQDMKIENHNCTATAAMTIVGDDLYCIRSTTANKDENPVVFQKIKNFLSADRTYKSVAIQTSHGDKDVARHANSLTYNKGTFYMATLNDPKYSKARVVAFGTDGVIQKEYTYEDPIDSINYYDTVDGKERFLVCVGHNDEKNYYRFHLIRAKGNTFEKEESFTVADCDEILNFNTGNDSFYDAATEKLYTTMFYVEDATIKKNIIAEYDIKAALKGEAKSVKAVKAMYVKATKESKLEIEGLCKYNKKIYVCTNTNDASGKEGHDAVYVLSKADA